jgi:hypothetical protein
VINEYFWDRTRPINPTNVEPLSLVVLFTKDQRFNISSLAFELIVSNYNTALGILGKAGTGISTSFSTSVLVGTSD